MSVGLIGLGQIGGRMALRLRDAGYDLTVYNRGEFITDVVDMGAQVVDSYQAVVTEADITVLCLFGPNQVEEVVLGPDGLVKAVSSEDVVVDTTTSLPGTTDKVETELRDNNASMLSASFSGTSAAARAGELTFMLAGSSEAYDRALPVVECLGEKIFYVGKQPKQADAMKLINNHLSVVNLLATMEAVALGERVGLDIETMVNVLDSSSGRGYATERYFPKFVVEDAPNRDAPLMEYLGKDIALAEGFADEEGANMALAEVARDMISEIEAEFGDHACARDMYESVAANLN